MALLGLLLNLCSFSPAFRLKARQFCRFCPFVKFCLCTSHHSVDHHDTPSLQVQLLLRGQVRQCSTTHALRNCGCCSVSLCPSRSLHATGSAKGGCRLVPRVWQGGRFLPQFNIILLTVPSGKGLWSQLAWVGPSWQNLRLLPFFPKRTRDMIW